MGDKAMIISQQAETTALAHVERFDQSPALVYLTGLNTTSSRRTMRAALDTIAGLLTSGQADCLTMPWPEIRFQHAQALRAVLSGTYQPATTARYDLRPESAKRDAVARLHIPYQRRTLRAG